MAEKHVSLTEALARGTVAAGDTAAAWVQFLRAVKTGTVITRGTADGVPEARCKRRWVQFLAEFGVRDEPKKLADLNHVEAALLPAGDKSLLGVGEVGPLALTEFEARLVDRTVRWHPTSSAPAPGSDMLWFDADKVVQASRSHSAKVRSSST